MKTQLFKAPGVWIERTPNGYYTAWKPDVSVICVDRKALLRFVQWPAKTPTGDAIRAWLDGFAANEKASDAPQQKPSLTDEQLATGFGPECHLDETDPNHHTRTII